MSIRTVEWCKSVVLPCKDCVPADVILCLKPDLVLQQEEFNTISFIEAQLIFSDYIPGSQDCECDSTKPRWKYVFTYDDAQLEVGTILKDSDILGAFCDDCRAEWTRQQNAQARQQVVSERTYLEASEFLGLPTGTTESLVLTIINPSQENALVGMIHWSWVLNAISVGAAYDVSITSKLQADNVDLADSQGHINLANTAADENVSVRSSTSGQYPYTVPPGETRVFELVLTSTNTVEPSTAFNASESHIAFFGVTE